MVPGAIVTDARLPGHWLNDWTLDGLSDRAWRTYAASLMWSAEQGTDGVLPEHAMRWLHPLGVDDETRSELVAAGRWEPLPRGFRVLPEWSTHQSLAADVEWQRERNRRKNKAARDRARTTQLPGHVTGHAGGEERQGEDRQERT
jgi:hypothetical protein